MIRLMRQNLAAMPTPPVPRGFVALQTLPEGLLVAMLQEVSPAPPAPSLAGPPPTTTTSNLSLFAVVVFPGPFALR